MITNPSSAHRQSDDFTTGLDTDGQFLYTSSQNVDEWVAGADIDKGQAVMIVAPTTTVGVNVVPMTAAVTAADSWRYVGIARDAAAEGQIVQVVSCGPVLALLDASDNATVYDLLLAPGTTTGSVDILAGAATDNSVIIGYALGAEATNNLVLAMVGQPLVRFEAGA